MAIAVLWRGALALFDPAWRGTALFWLPAHLHTVAIGMALAVAVVHGPRPKLRTGACWLVALTAFMVLAEFAGLPKGLAPVSTRQELIREVLHLVVAAALLAPLVLGPDAAARRPEPGSPDLSPHPTVVARFLLLRPVAWAGLVSYGIYLWHKTLVAKAVEWTGGDPAQLNGSLPATLAVAIPLTLIAAGLSHRLVEMPLVRRFQSARRPPG
jgi:peptidoglycan/LPS O-acetylase OafA/YrhL